MNNDDIVTESNEEPCSLSEVTPPKKKSWLLSLNRLTLSALVCIVLLVFAFMPQKNEAREKSEESYQGQKEYTLSENLALIEAMKKEHSLSQKETALPALHHEPITPPKLRSHPTLSKEIVARMNAPTSFFSGAPSVNNEIVRGETIQASSSLMTGNSANAAFINQQNDITSVSARRLPHPNQTIPAGEIIPATLETAIHSELPGMVRAITARDIYSLEGGHVLIPRGSSLIGQFNASLVEGQSRLLVVWNRVQLANGVIVTLNSPSTDSIGRSGQAADYINRHFIERFSMSALFSILGAYTANSGVNGQDEYNSRVQYRMNLASSFQQVSSQTLQENASIKPTLQINQGTQINVFVAHDLDFHGVTTHGK